MHHYAKTVNFIHIAQKTEETTFKSGRGRGQTSKVCSRKCKLDLRCKPHTVTSNPFLPNGSSVHFRITQTPVFFNVLFWVIFFQSERTRHHRLCLQLLFLQENNYLHITFAPINIRLFESCCTFVVCLTAVCETPPKWRPVDLNVPTVGSVDTVNVNFVTFVSLLMIKKN